MLSRAAACALALLTAAPALASNSAYLTQKILSARSPGEVLALGPHATEAEIKAAHRRLVLVFHGPADRGDTEATEIMKVVNSARDQLLKEARGRPQHTRWEPPKPETPPKPEPKPAKPRAHAHDHAEVPPEPPRSTFRPSAAREYAACAASYEHFRNVPKPRIDRIDHPPRPSRMAPIR